MKVSIFDILKGYQKQTCGNFSDLNEDMDEVKGHLLQIETLLENLLKERNTTNGHTEN